MKAAKAELGWVIYGSSSAKRVQMQAWAEKLGVSEQWIVNNHAASRTADELAGSNTAYEFSAYLQLARTFTGPGPFLLVNDTLFRNHTQRGWAWLTKKCLQASSESVIWGDIRKEKGEIPERPNVFLASWIFVIPDRKQLDNFVQVLEAVVQQKQQPSAAYEAYLQAWLQPGPWYKGWHGGHDPAAIARKRAAVQWEHGLSKGLQAAGVRLGSMGQQQRLLYVLIRWHDRLVTRWQAIRARFFS